MKPTKMVAHRQRSATARCTRMVPAEIGPFQFRMCGEPLILFVTPSPISTYETLVVVRCLEHIESGTGVLPESAESPWRW